jgi:hypothetical protein
VTNLIVPGRLASIIQPDLMMMLLPVGAVMDPMISNSAP